MSKRVSVLKKSQTTPLIGAAKRPACRDRRTRSKTDGTDVQDDQPFELVAPAVIKPALIQQRQKLASDQNDKLPKNIGDERIQRRRMAVDWLSASLGKGTHVDDVAKQAALRLIEKWTRLLWSETSHVQLAPTIIDFVYCGQIENPGEPLQSALLRVIPTREEADLICGWEFMDELVNTLGIEEQFDKKNHVHLPKCTRSEKLNLLCGGCPPIWEKVEGTDRLSDWSRSFKEPEPGVRRMAGICGSKQQTWAHAPRAGLKLSASIPCPGTYYNEPPQSILRADFPPVGRSRTTCFVSSLSHRPRTLSIG